jgi:hypothetical protein
MLRTPPSSGCADHSTSPPPTHPPTGGFATGGHSGPVIAAFRARQAPKNRYFATRPTLRRGFAKSSRNRPDRPSRASVPRIGPIHGTQAVSARSPTRTVGHNILILNQLARQLFLIKINRFFAGPLLTGGGCPLQYSQRHSFDENLVVHSHHVLWTLCRRG